MQADLYSSNPPLPPIRSHVYFIHCLSPNPGKVSSPSSLPQSPLLLPSPLCLVFHIALSPLTPMPVALSHGHSFRASSTWGTWRSSCARQAS